MARLWPEIPGLATWIVLLIGAFAMTWVGAHSDATTLIVGMSVIDVIRRVEWDRRRRAAAAVGGDAGDGAQRDRIQP